MQRHVNPRDVDLLLGDAIGRSLPWILAHDDAPLPPEQVRRVDDFLERRFRGEPVQYIRGRTEFYGREFRVDSRVLIPRPESEFVVETALEICGSDATIVDVGTGSGCIAVTLAVERPQWRVAAVDLSVAALAVARGNAERLGASVRFAASDVLAAIDARFDCIVSNPPYVPQPDIAGLALEVRQYEPGMALSPGTTGLEVIERLLVQARAALRPGGHLVFEIGFTQNERVAALARATGWPPARFVHDLAGIPRVVVLSNR